MAGKMLGVASDFELPLNIVHFSTRKDSGKVIKPYTVHYVQE
jgi:hypothetical protein